MQQTAPRAELLTEASALLAAGKLAEAEVVFLRLHTAYPHDADILAMLGTIRGERSDPEGSIRYFEQAIAINPSHAVAYCNYGTTLLALNRYDEALERLDKALSVHPDYAEAHSSRGTVLYRLQKYPDALASLDKAIALNPADANALNTRAGILLAPLGRYGEALTSCNQAIAINPALHAAYNNRGIILKHMKRYDEAFASFDKAIAMNPGYGDAYWNKGLLQLALGNYKEGWKLFEWRWKRSSQSITETRELKAPLWLGKEPLKGKTILLHTEQGLGDCIQFCRYVPMVEALGAEVILEVLPPLVSLMATLSKTIRIMACGEPLPRFDSHCPLMSLPLAFKTTLDTVPARFPYLAAKPAKQAYWQERLGTKTKPRIGLAWSGAADHPNDHNRTMPLKLLAPLLALDYDFHSLQKQVRLSDKAFLADSNIISHADDLHDFSDTAALAIEMDMVISVDTSVAHLAGTLGKTVWIMLPHMPDFRWRVEGNYTPWYPSARLFRQQESNDWRGVIADIKTELQRQLT